MASARGLESALERIADPDLVVTLENAEHLPSALPTRKATAVFCFGHCFHRHRDIDSLVLLVDGVRHRPTATRMPRRDLFEWLHDARGDDPEGRSYRAGFWATLPIPAREQPGHVVIEAAVRVDGASELIVPLTRIEVARPAATAWPGPPAPPMTIAICMATYEPDLDLFQTQVESIRAQTDDRWICVISDDGTSWPRFERMLEVLSDDPRFRIRRAEKRAGPYRNFERALALAPAGAPLMAPCDQDDRWYPDKLAVLRSELGAAQLVYCDQRLVTPNGRVLSESLWQGRRNDYENLASLLVANTIAGGGMLFRREVAELALPFPNAPGAWYHDHWLALVALASGEIAYVDRPLYDYVQHRAAVSGALIERQEPRSPPGSRGLRSAYFGGFMTREVQAQTLLVRCAALLTPSKRRALERFVASPGSPSSFIWLAARPLRRLLGRDETLGGEWALARGIVWRWLLPIAVGRSRTPGRHPFDASFPDPPRFEQRRLRRWRAGV